MLRYFLVAFVLTLSLKAGDITSNCLVINGAYVAAKDISPAYPEFSVLADDTTLSYAPAPGSRRIVSATEIEGWGKTHAVKVNARRGVCLERAGNQLTADDYRRAIRDQLKPNEGAAEIELFDFYSRVLPPGHLELPLAGAALPPTDHPETAFLWRGQLIATDGGSYPVWARVRVSAKRELVKTVRNLPAGTTLEAEQLTSSPAQCNPLRVTAFEPLSFYIGKSLTRSVAGASRLDPSMVQDPPTVQRGEKVRVAVVSGPAHIELEAFADGPGYVGDVVAFSNASGSRHFRALITGSGQAEIVLNGSMDEPSHRTTVQRFATKGTS